MVSYVTRKQNPNKNKEKESINGLMEASGPLDMWTHFTDITKNIQNHQNDILTNIQNKLLCLETHRVLLRNSKSDNEGSPLAKPNMRQHYQLQNQIRITEQNKYKSFR